MTFIPWLLLCLVCGLVGSLAGYRAGARGSAAQAGDLTDADDHDLVVLRSCGGNLEATVLRSVLQAHGILCHFQSEHHRTLFAVPAMEARLLVPAHQLDEANLILREGEREERTGGYRDIYPLPGPAPEAAGPPLWQAYHTRLAVAFVLLVLGMAVFVRLTF